MKEASPPLYSSAVGFRASRRSASSAASRACSALAVVLSPRRVVASDTSTVPVFGSRTLRTVPASARLLSASVLGPAKPLKREIIRDSFTAPPSARRSCSILRASSSTTNCSPLLVVLCSVASVIVDPFLVCEKSP